MVGPPESIFDWTKELDSDLANQNSNNQAFSRKYWRLLQCQNGELVPNLSSYMIDVEVHGEIISIFCQLALIILI